ncbi:unnamed protein product [Haemonchus placei]|uniref:TTKRSYEDQ domain-containing protein n=1 Tax=Haemonchus placei TaxID=6290 RepID=A0A0N4X8T7_HAEPC|nr:unnamed protein product [Haemonchus placei]
MHLHLRSVRGVDAKGRVHISLEDMAEIYRNFHAALSETYWETASNHKICTDAMEMLKTTHISKKNGRFLFLFTSVLSEAYSHAHYNIQELLYDNRDEVRTTYWSDILMLYKAVMMKADKVYSHTKCSQRLALLLHFATLYSLYKDVAEEDFIISLYQLAEEYFAIDKHRLTDSEVEQIKEYHDAIQTIYYLRGEHRKVNGQGAALEPDEAPTLVINEEDVVEDAQTESPSKIPLSKDELCAIYDEALKRHQKIVLKRQQTLDQERLEGADSNTLEVSIVEENGAASGMDVAQTSTQRLQSNGQSAHIASEVELESAIKNLNSSATSDVQPNVAENSSIANGSDKADNATKDDIEELIETLDAFDYKEEFDRRFRQRKAPRTNAVDLPVIGRPNKGDVVHSYRRRGLFDNINYRQPSPRHRIASIDSSDNGAMTHVAFSFDEMDLIQVAEESREPNNNTLSPNTCLANKIVRAVLAERPVSPIQPRHRRRSLII